MTLSQPDVDGGPVLLRRAEIADVPALVALRPADQSGPFRDGGDGAGALAPCERAFAAIDADPAHLLVVGTRNDDVVATLQLSVLPAWLAGGRHAASVSGLRSS